MVLPMRGRAGHCRISRLLAFPFSRFLARRPGRIRRGMENMVDFNKPLIHCPEDDRRFASPAMRVAVVIILLM